MIERKWWKESVVYQIYPRSFLDSSGDGVGDLKGIIQKLDYIKKLGIDIIWLNPIYKSPNDDNGYDISDYKSIMNEYGSTGDWENLLDELHKRDIRLIMDLVVNHTSSEHKWFKESRSSKDNPYRNYYIWKKTEDNKLPNNWGSFFSGSAWEFDDNTGEYYLHLFSKSMPDLNWENDKLRKDIYEMMKWWLDKGVDGFRMDVIGFLAKNRDFPDVENKYSEIAFPLAWKYFSNQPKVHDYLKEMNDEVLSKYDIMTVGEVLNINPDEALLYVGSERKELNMIFHFEHMTIDTTDKGWWSKREWKLNELKKIFSNWQYKLNGKGWNSQYLNNHDQPRMVSRFGNDGKYRVESAKMLATFLHSLQGTPYILQGEEIGMTNVAYPSIEDYRDIQSVNFYKEAIQNNIMKADEVLEILHERSRDNGRTPMQWDDTHNAGFTNGEPWIKVNPNYKKINVKQALEDKNSIFYYYKNLIRLRKENLIFVYGDYKLLLEDNEEIYSYLRTLEDEKLLVILNFYNKEPVFNIPKKIKYNNTQLLISNYTVENPENLNNVKLKPYEARIYRLT